MTRGIEEMLNLPDMGDMLQEPDLDNHTTTPSNLNQNDHLAMVEGLDHSEAMDALYTETLRHARDVMDMGFNIEPTRSARMFEVATGLYGKAMEAKNSKRDAQLKTMKLALEQRKLEILENQNKSAANTIESNGHIIISDRNDLIKQMREQIKKGG